MRLLRTTVVVAVLAAIAAPAALALRFTDESYFVPKGVVGQPYSHWFKGDGGCGPGLPYQFRIIGGELPPGLWLRTNGLLGGTPTEAGRWSFWVELSDQDPPTQDWCRPAKSQREFTVVVVGAVPDILQPPLAIATTRLASTTVGRRFAFRVRSLGGASPVRWDVTGGRLPVGIRLDARTGLLVGRPGKPGSFRFTMRVRDAGGAAATRTFVLRVHRRAA